MFAPSFGANPRWREARVNSQSNYNADVFLDDGRIVKARIKVTSPSGDWDLIEDYYFYGNGYTAFRFMSLITFQGYDYEHDRELPKGPYIVEKRDYYNEQGKVLRSIEKAFVKKTKQVVPVKYIRVYSPLKLYQDVTSLPFYKVIALASACKK